MGAERERHALATRLFQEACALPPERRRAFVRAQSGDDAELRAQVERLLDHDQDTAGFLEQPLDPDSIPAGAAGHARPPTRVGSYRVLELLGRGGMGVVYRARQDRPDREIALKLIRPELWSEAAVRRFEQEAELLGRLQHPGIAQIYEAGQTRVRDSAAGEEYVQPFLAMELVVGANIRPFVAARRLAPREVVELLAPICEAVQHAHQRGVLHLDLKPANILVDESGRPRVLDFGVAQAIEPAQRRRLAPRSGDVAGTIAYMAPEQLLGKTEEFDTRTDIYALGALAYELIAGSPPYDLRGARLEDAIMAVLVSEPPRLRRAAPHVSRELAAVIERAVARDQEARYPSVGEFAADLRRFLRFEPVQALPARAWRSARLFARRHTGPAVAGLLALAVAAAGVTALGVGLVRANDSAKEARQANRAAQQQAQRAARMAHFLEATLFGVDPEERGPHASFFDAIDYAAGRVHRDLADVPEVEADVRFSLGFVYRRHGLYAKATDQLRAALHIRERVLGERDPRTLKVIEELGFLAYAHTGDFDAAALLLGRALETHEQAGRADSESAAWLGMKLGLVRLAQDDLRAAEALFERSRGPLEREYGSAYASRPMRELARCALRGGDAARAESLAREALRRCATAEEQEYIAARVRLTLAEACLATGKLDEADAIARDAQEALRKLLPETHPEVADLELVLARLERARGDASRARTHAEKSLQMRRALLDARHPAILEAEVALAEIAVRSGADTPVPDLPRLFERAETELGADHWLTIEVLRVIHAHAAASGDDSAVRRHAATLARLAQRRAERLAAQ